MRNRAVEKNHKRGGGIESFKIERLFSRGGMVSPISDNRKSDLT